MPSYISLLDIAKLTGSDQTVGVIEENLTVAPEFSRVLGRTIAGTSYQVSIRKTFPTTQFRQANMGVPTSASVWDKKTVECYILDAQMEADKAIADTHPFGKDAFLADEASAQVKSALITAGNQFYYGNPSPSDFGFPGLVQLYDPTTMLLKAGAGTANANTSVWFCKLGLQGVNFVFGNGGRIDMAEDWRTQKIIRTAGGTTNGSLTAYINGLTAWIGLQTGSKWAVGRLANLTATVTLTDALIGQMLYQFPIGFRPDVIFMNRQSALQLQTSRGANSSRLGGGNIVWAPQPTDSNGVPIILTDSILNTEATVP